MTVADGTDSCPAGTRGPDAVPVDAVPVDMVAAGLAAEDDVELLRLVRAGHDAAFGELFTRHAAAVRGFAMRCCTDVADAEDMAAEAFFRVLQAVRRGAGPDGNVRAYLLTVVRRLAAEWSVRRRDVPVADDELSRQVDAGYTAPASRADLQLIARAFTSLPQRWRTVLWRVEVEGERPAVVARHFGLSANATAALARRARQGLQAAYLQAHLAPTGGATGCRSVVDKLGAFTAGQVTGTEAARIRSHIAGCPTCQALHSELLDVCAGLRRHAGAITPPVLGAALGAHHASGAHALLGKAGLGKVGLGKAGLGKVGLIAGRLAGHVAVFGARAKLVVAAVSMAAVGGVGVAAGPLINHLSPSPEADRGVVVGPQLLSSGPSGAPDGSVAHGSVAHGTAGGAFDPTMRAALHGPAAPSGVRNAVSSAMSTAVSTVAGAVTGGDMKGADMKGADMKGADINGGDANASATDLPAMTTTGEQMSVQRAQLPAPATTTTTGPREAVVGMTTTPTDTPTVTEWSTSWTTNGTTVWEWWSESDG